MQFLKEHGVAILGGSLLLAALGVGYLYLLLTDARQAATTKETDLTSQLAASNETVSTRDARILELEALLEETKVMLEETLEDRDDISRDLRREKNRNEEFEEQIDKIGSTVGVLDKLAKTDPELLQKYSKVYFLNEHYIPPKLTAISNQYVYREGEPEFLHAQAYPFFRDMVEDALEDGVKLWVISAFRSFDEQRALKSAYSVTYGSGANTFSADQGYSEHQLGTAVDFTTENRSGALDGFDTTAAYTWLLENAHEYGFVLSYPKDNAYYVFEPWHWRFVGTELAKDLKENGQYFYDADQREIDAYLVSIFD